MIETTCPACGGKVLQPDPPGSVLTQEQKIAFRKDWDERYVTAKNAQEGS